MILSKLFCSTVSYAGEARFLRSSCLHVLTLFYRIICRGGGQVTEEFMPTCLDFVLPYHMPRRPGY